VGLSTTSTEHVPLQYRLLAVICRLRLLVTKELAGCPWMCPWFCSQAMGDRARDLSSSGASVSRYFRCCLT
jgi:hypothetical protein